MSMHLAFGPVSTESIEAVFRYSSQQNKELMLIASKNQIDCHGGYVNNWSTREYMDHIRILRGRYAASSVRICRDHCGPGFNGKLDLKDTYDTLRCDIETGFDLIHIDFCHHPGSAKEKRSAAGEAISFCQGLASGIQFEIGTDENTGTVYGEGHLDEIERDLAFFRQFCQPEFFVVQTGSLVKEQRQVGTFNKAFASHVRELLKQNGVKLKEHNADYLSKDEIRSRLDSVDAMNIAPQLGVIQTASTIKHCLTYGVCINDFANLVYSERKWVKWLNGKDPVDKVKALLIAGHYHFGSVHYQRLVDQLRAHIDPEETFVGDIMSLIRHYDAACSGAAS